MASNTSWVISKRVHIIGSNRCEKDGSYTAVLVEAQNKARLDTARKEMTYTNYDKNGNKTTISYNELEVDNGKFMVELLDAPGYTSKGGRYGGCEVRLRHTDFPNKVWKIGLSIDSIFEIIKETTIVNGIIQTPLWWARYNGESTVLCSNTKRFKDAVDCQKSRDSRVTTTRKYPGKIYSALQKKDVYLGEVYILAEEKNMECSFKKYSAYNNCGYTGLIDIKDTAICKRQIFQTLYNFKELTEQESDDNIKAIKFSEYLNLKSDGINQHILEQIKKAMNGKTVYGMSDSIGLPSIKDKDQLLKTMPSRVIDGTAIEMDIPFDSLNAFIKKVVDSLVMSKMVSNGEVRYIDADSVISLLSLSATKDRGYKINPRYLEVLVSITDSFLILRYDEKIYASQAAKNRIDRFRLDGKVYTL